MQWASRHYLWLAVIIGLMCVGVGVYRYRELDRFLTLGSDTLEYASTARSLARGGGFSCDSLYPLAFGMQLAGYQPEAFGEATDPRPPVYHRPPVWPVLLAGFFLVFGVHLESVWLLSVFFHAATVALALYYFRRRPKWALLAAAFIGLSPHLLRSSISGLTESPAAFLVLLLWLLHTRAGDQRWPVFLAGVVVALGWLTKAYLILLAPMSLLDLILRPGRRKAETLILFMLGFALAAAPWMVRNTRLTGDPIFSLQTWFEMAKYVPGYMPSKIQRGLEPLYIADFIRSHPREMVIKFGVDLFQFAKGFALIFCAFWPLAIVRVLQTRHRHSGPRTPVFTALGTPLLAALAIAPFNNEIRYLVCFAPVIIAEIWCHLISWEETSSASARRVILASFATTVFLFFLYEGWRVMHPIAAPSASEYVGRLLAGRPPSLASAAPLQRPLIISDEAPFAAWHLDGLALRLPADESSLRYLLETYPVGAIYLEQGADSRYLAFYASFESFRAVVRPHLPVETQSPTGAVWFSR